MHIIDSIRNKIIKFFYWWSTFPCNKTTFKRTRSLSNAVCFKHGSNVCACISGHKFVTGNRFEGRDFIIIIIIIIIVIVIILTGSQLSLPHVAKKTKSQIDDELWFAVWSENSSSSVQFFCIFRRFFTAHAQFRPYYNFRQPKNIPPLAITGGAGEWRRPVWPRGAKFSNFDRFCSRN